MSDIKIPEVFVRNGVGYLVPVDQVREQDKLCDQVARELASGEGIEPSSEDFQEKVAR